MNAPESPIFFDSFGDDAACPSLAAALSAGAGCGCQAMTFLDRGGETRTLPYCELLARSRAIAAGLTGRGLGRGAPAILCFDDDLALVEALWAVWLCGAVPAPLSAPAGYSAKDEALAKLLVVDSQCAAQGQTPLILSDLPFATLAGIDSFRQQVAPERFVTPATLTAPDADWGEPTVAPDELALLMFSSGSTGDPKGVRLSHRQIMANLRQIREISAFQATDRSLNWLPLTHDMGLILFHICHTLAGIPQYKMSPLAFARDPASLLDLACAHGITLLGMPNFGYDQLLRVAEAAEPQRWQLERIRLIYNGAEPIDAGLCRRFNDGLARFGLRRHLISPGWGIAEAAVVASGFTVAELARWHDLPSAWIDRRAGLAVGDPVVHCLPGSPQALEIVSLGPPLTGMSVRVLDDDGRELGPDRFGHLEITGPNVSSGYFGQADVAWIATGDIGFIHDGRVHLTGRAKDVIFINGRNRFSNDIEADLCRELDWPANQLAVVGITDPERKVELIAVFFRAERGGDRQRTARRIRDAAERLLGYPVAGAIPLAGLPKTTSGKIRRFVLRHGLLAGDYDRQLAADAGPGRPQTAGEAALAALVAPLLKTTGTAAALDPEAPLSRYGLDSVGFMQLAFAITRERAVELTPPQLIGAATLAAIAALVARAPRIPADRETAGMTVALTPRQQLLWTAWQLESDSRAYNETYGLRLIGAIDGERWRRAAEEVVTTQPMLRARVVAGQEAHLALADTPGADIRVESCADAELVARMETLAGAAFDLRRGPLVRLCLLRGETTALLFVSAHHLIADGWSLHQLISRIFDRYCGAELPAAETLLWREAPRFAPERLAEAATAFRTGEAARLPGEPDPGAAAVAQATHTLAPTTTAALRAWRAATGSDFGAIAAALLVLLGRLCDCRRPLLATVTSGRFDLRARDRFGYFARTQPLSADLDPEIGFDALVAAIEPQRLAMLGGDTPDLAELELAGADLARKLRVVYVHQNLPTIRVGPELHIDGLIQHRSKARADLCVSSAWHGDRLEFTWEYDGQYLGREQTLAYAELLEHVLGQLLATPERPIGKLQLLSPGQQRRWRAYGIPEDPESDQRDVISRIEDRIRHHPDLTALSDRNERLSYGALGVRVDALCRRLEEAGITSGDRVALLTDRSADYIVGLLACLKMAAIAVPLDPGQPPERIELILRESRADLILATGGAEPVAGPAAGHRVLGFTGAELVPGAAHPGRPTDGTDGAYLIFTSGSTGQPKGVLIPRGAFANLAAWVTTEFGYRPGETLCQFAPFSFDVSMAEILPSLCTGLHVHVLPDEHRASPALYLAALREQGTHIATVTPAYLTVLNESPAACREHLQSLRLLILGGEALMTEEVRRFREHSPHVAIVNVYGPTETTVLSTAYRVPAEPDPRRAWQPLGRPIRATEIWILDAAGRVCPATVTGTLHIGGAGLAHGYWNDPEKTARAFRLRDPDGRGERRFYDSGDLARLNSAGELEFVGRADTQIKLRGFRIELGEIEAVLARHPGVDQAVVCAPVRDGGERALAAYYSGDGEPAALADFLRARLPAYMQPAAYVRMSAWPLNDNRKVDRARLPPPQWGTRAAGTAAAPATATETVLAEIWSQLLGTTAISRHDNFALLGGSSIAAAQLVNRIRDRCGRELPLIKILRAADLASMAAAVDRAESADLPEPERSTRPRPADLAASEAQARMVFLEHRHAGTALNTIPLTLALSAPIEPQRLRQAATALAARHWILRVGLAAGARGVRQIDAGGAPDLHVVSCADTAAALEVLANFQGDSFELMPGPLWRLALVSAADGGCWLALNLHHAVADGVTLVRVLDELDVLYRGETLPPPDDEFDYEDFRLWQERLLSGPWAERMYRDWADPRRQCPLLPLPHPGGRREHVAGRQFVVDLDAGQTGRLKALCTRHRVRPFQLMLAIFGFVLGQRCASRRFAVGITLSGRSRQVWERVPGLFVNTLPLAFDWADDERFVDLLARLDERLAELQDRQDFPLNRVMAAQKQRDPPFEVLFNEEMLPPCLHFAGAPVELAAVGSGIAKMPLVVSFLLAGEPWRWRIEHRDDACPADWVAGLNDEVKRLINLLDGMGEARLVDLQSPDEHLMALLDLPCPPRLPDPTLIDRVTPPMGLQETVLDLFRDQRIDKATAYRLLNDAKKASAAAEPALARIDCRLPPTPAIVGEPVELALVSFTYLLHIIGNENEVELDYLDSRGRTRLRIHIDDAQTPARLLAQARQADPAEWPPATYAFLAPGATDNARRRISAAAQADSGGVDGAVTLQLCAEPLAEGATAVADWADTLVHLHAGLWREPEATLAGLDRLPPRHRQLIAEYNATGAYLPPQPTLPALLDPVLALEDESLAVRTTEASLSYGQLRRRAYRIAHALRHLGVRRNERVGVIMQRDTSMPAVLYGIISAGAAYVGLEPDTPQDRLQLILKDTGARIVITDADTLHAHAVRFPEFALTELICADPWPRGKHQAMKVRDAAWLGQFPDRRPEPVNAPDDLCYVIYTSGSTGRPKGVMISHKALVNSLIGINNLAGLGPEDKVLVFSSYAFDLSVWDMFGTLLAGAAVIMPTKEQTRDPAALLQILRDHQVTVWDSVPTGMAQLLQPLANRPVEPLPNMRLIILGGEFTPPALIPEIKRIFPNGSLANCGGATEGTIYSIGYYPVKGFAPHWKALPYGKPLQNQRFYVLNDALNFCAIGQKGMLYIGGLGVATGYLGDEERTRRAFIQAPWSTDPGDRLYRTGDLGIMRADGLADICGRADDQVKIRGFRVELGEIEARLSAIPGIDQGAVLAQPDDSGQRHLVAFYTSNRGKLPAEQLRTELAANLPDYMLPSRFIHMTEPPIGQTGKLDRKRLVADAPGAPRAERAADGIAAGDIESRIAAELARMLRLERVAADDDFFLIGGDSLLSLQYQSILAAHGFETTPLDIMQGRTLREILTRAGTAGETVQAGQDALIPHTPMSRKFFERLPLVNRDHWHQLLVIGFDHNPDQERLRTALRRVIDHHPLLRARCVEGGLQVDEHYRFTLPAVDLGQTPFFLRGLRLEEQARALRAQLTLAGPSLGAAVLVRMGERDSRLLWVLHHLVVDANCWRTLVDDLATAYRNPRARLLRAGPVADHVRNIRQGAQAARAELAGRPRHVRMQVPGRSVAAGEPPTGLEGDSLTRRAVFSPEQTERLFRAIRRHGSANLNLMLLSALSLAMAAWAGRREVRFDIISNGRAADAGRDYSRSIGWFATHNPFLVELSGALGQTLPTVAAAWERYQENSRYFVEVCNDVNGDPDHPLGAHVDQALLFSFLGDFDTLNLPEGWSILGTLGVNRAAENLRTHEMELEAMVVRGRLMLRLVYARTRIGRNRAQRLLGLVREGLEQLIRHYETAVEPSHS